MNVYTVSIQGTAYQVEFDDNLTLENDFIMLVDNHPVNIKIALLNDHFTDKDWIIVDNQPFEIKIDPELKIGIYRNKIYPFELRDHQQPGIRPISKDGRIKAPIPGIIRQINIVSGEEVVQGQSLLVLEAMKMENEILSPCNGVIEIIHAKEGNNVSLGEILLEYKAI
jgi:biotin carboxyl carrier protein